MRVGHVDDAASEVKSRFAMTTRNVDGIFARIAADVPRSRMLNNASITLQNTGEENDIKPSRLQSFLNKTHAFSANRCGECLATYMSAMRRELWGRPGLRSARRPGIEINRATNEELLNETNKSKPKRLTKDVH